MPTTALHDLVAKKIDRHWNEWSKAHPHLASILDRTRLVDSTVDRLRSDAEFAEAMRQANLDESQLAAAARLLDQAERWILRFMPL